MSALSSVAHRRARPVAFGVVLASLALAGSASAGTIKGFGAVIALTNINQMSAIVGHGNFDEGPTGGGVPLNVYTPQGLTWVNGPLSIALPGCTNTGSAFQPEYSNQYGMYFPAPIGGGGIHTLNENMFAGVATFSTLVTQVGLTASSNGEQYLTAFAKNGSMIGQVDWTPAGDSSFVGIDTMGVPIAMIAYGNHDLWMGQGYDIGGATIISDSWVWASGCPSTMCCSDAQCDDGNPCTTDSCNLAAGTCTYTDNTLPCSTGNSCTSGDACSNGACVAGPSKPDGSACTDGDLCNQSHACMAGVCVGSNPVTCAPLDGCHLAGVCSPTTGTCSNPVKVDGSACSGTNLCEMSPTCMGGVCTGTPVMCAPTDSCHQTGTCDMTTGMCTNPALPDGTPCDDGNMCTLNDTCTGGTCMGGATVTCPTASPCQDVAACDPTSGMCALTNKPDGTACNDNNACSMMDACTQGTCVGMPVTCAAMDACHAAGTCDPMAGCSNPALPDGTPCPNGSCVSGACETGSGGSGVGGNGTTGATSSAGSSGGTPGKSSGCGCGVADGGAGGASGAGLLLALALRRRRRAAGATRR